MQTNNRNNDDCGCEECCACGDCCCNDCFKDCECNECGCDCISTIQTDCFQGWQCCACMSCCTAGDILTELHFNRHVDEEEENQVLSQQFKELISNYKITKQFNHPILQESYILHKKKKALNLRYDKLLLKSYWFKRQKEYQEQLQKFLTINLQTPFIQGIYGTRVSDICIDRWRLCVIFLKLHPLHKQLNFQVPSFLAQCSNQLLEYHANSIAETSHFFTDLVQFDQNDYYIISPQLNEKTLYQKYLENNKIIHPPEWESKEQSINFDWDKSDSFLLGICALSIVTKFKIEDMYSNGIYDENRLTVYLNRASLLLANDIKSLFDSMLQKDPLNRCSLSQIKDSIKVHLINHPIAKTNNQQPLSQNQTTNKKQMNLSNVGIYSGDQLNQRRNGFGRLDNPDGSYYEGDWVEDLMQGKGELYGVGGQLLYKGSFFQGKFHNFGHLTNIYAQAGFVDYRDLKNIKNFWMKYEGDFKMDRKHGHGILYFCNGDKWAGEFKDDVPHGFGTYTGGEQISGTWENGILQKQQ